MVVKFQLFFICCLFTGSIWAQDKFNWKKATVLVYTKNGAGYVHDNIPYAVNCIQQFGKKYGFKVDTSSNAAVMAETNLRKYTLLIFPSTNNDVFETNEQRLAFRRYIEAGGGFVGIHSVTGTERNWKWFKMMLGGTFSWHAKFQPFKVRKIDTSHPSITGLPAQWVKDDEFYFAKELYPGPKVLMANDITSLDTSNAAERNNIIKNAGTYTELYPSVWVHDFDGGHTWVTTLGHDKADYSNPVYMQHILQGIRYVASRYAGLNFKKAYATSWNAPLNY